MSDLPKMNPADFLQASEMHKHIKWQWILDPVPWFIFEHIEDRLAIKEVTGLAIKHMADVASLKAKMYEKMAEIVMKQR